LAADSSSEISWWLPLLGKMALLICSLVKRIQITISIMGMSLEQPRMTRSRTKA